MPPPQFSSDRPRPRPGDSSVPAVKRPPPASHSAAAASAKIARPASAPDLTALSAARPRPPPPTSAKLAASPPDRKLVRPMPLPLPQAQAQPQHLHRGLAPHAARPRPPSTPAKNHGGDPPAASSVPRRPAAASHDAAACRKPASFMAPRGAQTVRPARRLAPGTAVYVRTAFRPCNINCRILLWLPARVVSASDAYHLTVKYAASLNDMFAGKIVSKPVEHVRVAPHHRTAAKAAAETKAPSLSRR